MDRRMPLFTRPTKRFNTPFSPNEYGVIVRFDNGKYSVKTETRCYWCMSQYWDSEENVRSIFKNLHQTVLIQKDFVSSIGMQNTIKEMINEIKQIKK